MDIYTYVATSNPYQAKSILHKYGYSAKDVQTEADLGVCLKKLVAYEGQNAFNDVLSSHPDKEVLVEKYLVDNKGNKSEYKNCDGGCSCGGCNSKRNEYMNFSGALDTASNKSKSEIGLFIIASALLLATAIISKNK
jgi:hypothetical protein